MNPIAHTCIYILASSRVCFDAFKNVWKHVPVTILELITGLSASPKSEVNAKYRKALANPDV